MSGYGLQPRAQPGLLLGQMDESRMATAASAPFRVSSEGPSRSMDR